MTECISDREERVAQSEPRNLFALAVHHILLRVGWVFKTESVIMPAFLDFVSTAGWLRGCLPILNRLGQSVATLVFAERLRKAPRKRTSLFATTWLMAVPFLVLSWLWNRFGETPGFWLAPVFLCLYVVFFCVTGLNQLSFGTLQGKLIRPTSRGRLMGLAGIPGSLLAMTLAWYLLREWLHRPNGGFDLIFGCTALGFIGSGFAVLLVREEPDAASNEDTSRLSFRELAGTVKQDPGFQRLLIASMLFISAQLLFPHYQALGRNRPDYSPRDLMYWVIVQNAGAGFFAWLAGRVADRRGNKLALQWEFLGAAGTPLVALLFGIFAPEMPFFWFTFFLLGTVPTAFRTFSNYVLELTSAENHPRYLSILRVVMSLPLMLSPLIGWMIDLVGFVPVFVTISALNCTGWLYSFRLVEPRDATL